MVSVRGTSAGLRWRVLGELQQGLGGWVASVRGTSTGLRWLGGEC